MREDSFSLVPKYREPGTSFVVAYHIKAAEFPAFRKQWHFRKSEEFKNYSILVWTGNILSTAFEQAHIWVTPGSDEEPSDPERSLAKKHHESDFSLRKDPK